MYCCYAAELSPAVQLRKQLATESERQTESELSKQADFEAAPFFSSWGSSVEPVHLISTLKAYKDLGFHPSEGLLTAAEPFLCCLQMPLPLQAALNLASLFEAFSWRPGVCAHALSA